MAQPPRWDQQLPRWEDKEVTIKLRPWKVLKLGIALILLFGVFFLGRWSVDASMPTFDTDDSFFTKAVKKADAVSGTAVATLKNNTASTASTTSAPVTTETAATVVNTTIANDTVNDTSTTGAAASTETLLTAYSGGKIALSLNEVRKEWKGTWGKITHVDVTIKNNEVGTIQPGYFTMLVEGYEDVDKKITLPASAQELQAGKSYAAVIPVLAGFAYSSVTAGDLTNVKITLALFDVNNKQMTSFFREFNLQG